MLYAGISGLCSLLTFWFPLLLTAKLLSNINSTAYITSSLIASVNFLLNYWLCYIVVTYIEGSDVVKALANNYAGYGFSAMKLWLFYGHGCLIMNNYYVDSVFQRIFIKSSSKSPVATLPVLEANLIDPLVVQFVTRNFLVQNLARLFLNSRIGLVRELVAYNYELARALAESGSSKSERTSFLQFSLDYLCFMDNPSDLNQRFQNSKNILTHFLSVVSLPPVDSDAKYSKDGNVHGRSIKKSYSDLDYAQEKARRMAKSDSRKESIRHISLPASLEYPVDESDLRGRAGDYDSKRVYSTYNPSLSRKPLSDDQLQYLVDQEAKVRYHDQISKSIDDELERRKIIELERQKINEAEVKHHQQQKREAAKEQAVIPRTMPVYSQPELPHSKLKPTFTSELPAPGKELHYVSTPNSSRTTSPKDASMLRVTLVKGRSNSSNSPRPNLGFLKTPPRRNRASSVSSIAIDDL